MTDSALVLHYAPAAAARPAARDARRDVRAEWALGSAFLAALIVALMIVAGAFAHRTGVDNEWATWASLWFVAFVALMGGARVAARLGRQALRLGAAWRAYRNAVRTESELRAAAQGDPRVLQELRVMRDRAEWRAADR